MNNILSRKEYLQSMNEGLIGDVAKKIGKGVKNLFKIGMKKIKDFRIKKYMTPLMNV